MFSQIALTPKSRANTSNAAVSLLFQLIEHPSLDTPRLLLGGLPGKRGPQNVRGRFQKSSLPYDEERPNLVRLQPRTENLRTLHSGILDCSGHRGRRLRSSLHSWRLPRRHARRRGEPRLRGPSAETISRSARPPWPMKTMWSASSLSTQNGCRPFLVLRRGVKPWQRMRGTLLERDRGSCRRARHVQQLGRRVQAPRRRSRWCCSRS